jgi:hypothetical protein
LGREEGGWMRAFRVHGKYRAEPAYQYRYRSLTSLALFTGRTMGDNLIKMEDMYRNYRQWYDRRKESYSPLYYGILLRRMQ